MSFLGRKLYSHFQGDVVSDLTDFAFKRLPGIRIKHRVKQNWLKMYNKAGSVLRLEMVADVVEGRWIVSTRHQGRSGRLLSSRMTGRSSWSSCGLYR